MASSVYYELLQSVQSALRTLLSPATLASSSIVIQDVPKYSDDLAKPYIVIAPVPRETPIGGTTAREDIEYPILVAYISDPDASQLDARLKIREQIRRRFQFNSLTCTLASLLGCRVEPALAVDVQAWLSRGLFISPMVVQVKVREAKS